MSKNVTITKEMILASAFDIVREKGLEGISNRELAKKLNCSIRPIYYQFQNVEELYNELYVEIEKYFYKFLMDNMNDDMPKYKQVGINYIKFAKEEKEFFKILFMSEVDLGLNDFIAKDMEDFKELSKLIKISTNLNDEDIESFHIKMWIFSHGLATLVASSTLNISDKQLKQLLSLEFQALMLLEENQNNKWILNNKDWRDNNE